MGLRQRLTTATGRWCFWGSLAALLGAGGLRILPPLETVLSVLAIALFGVYCAARGPGRVPPAPLEDGD